MKIDDIKTVFNVAQIAFDVGIPGHNAEVAEAADALDAVRDWLKSVGALTATVKPKRGAKVLDARSRAAGKAGTKRRQRA